MTLKATVETLSAETAILRTMDGQLLTIPTSAIHGVPAMGGEVRILVSTGMADQPQTQDLARELLNELIQPSA